MKNIIFVTGNRGKFESARKHFLDSDIELEWYKYDATEPNINDIEYIARDKVINAYNILRQPCITLDAGFYINNFPNNPGFPGAFPKRELLDKIGLEGLLEIMSNVSDRSCYFMECLAYYDGTEVKYFYGISKGTLATSIKGVDSDHKWSDLWYIFIPDNHIHTLAEMNEEERNNRRDNHTTAFKEFIEWYRCIKIKQLT